MIRLIAIICFLLNVTAYANPTPVFWQFEGPFAESLENAFTSEQRDDEGHHLISQESRRSYITNTLPSVEWSGCLVDEANCRNDAIGILDSFGLKARAVVQAERTNIGYRITLTFETAEQKQPLRLEAESKTLNRSARTLLNALKGQGTLSISVAPKSAFLFIDDLPFGQGEGDFLVSSGSRTLRAEAPGYKAAEIPVQIKRGERLAVRLDLETADAVISLRIKPKTAAVFLDGKLWSSPEKERKIAARKWILRVENKGYKTFTQEIELKPNSVSELKLTLEANEPLWRRTLKSKVKSASSDKLLNRIDWSIMSIRDRRYDLGTNLGRLTELTTPLSSSRIGLSVGLRSRKHLLIDALRLSYSSATGPSNAKMEGFSNVQIDTINRLKVSPLWIGLQTEIWRITPYALTGLGLAVDSIKGRAGEGRFTANDVHVTLGLELGLRYIINQHFFAGLNYLLEGLPGSGAHVGMGISLGFSLDTPETVKAYLP